MYKRMICVVLAGSILAAALCACSLSARKKTEVYFENLVVKATVNASENAESAAALCAGNGTWRAEQPGAYMELVFEEEVLLNTILLQEPSDCVTGFSVYYWKDGDYALLYQQDRIDAFRLCATEDVRTAKLKIVFDGFEKTLKLNMLKIGYLKDYNRRDFKVTSYLTSAVDAETGKTQIDLGQSDAGYSDRFAVLTDVIIIGNVFLNLDGTIRCEVGLDHFKNDVAILKKWNPNMKVRCTLMTGLVPDDFNANKRAVVKLVNSGLDEYQKNLAAFVQETGVDGIDFDWEYPQLPHEWSAYSKLLIATKQALGGADLSVALWPYGVRLSKEARAAVDNVNIMAYDQFDARGDHSSIYDSGQKTIDYFLKLGFSKEQLCFGIPFYGRTADEYAIWPSYDADYGKWTNYRENFTYQDAEGVSHTSTVFLNGYAMVRDKTALALYNDLGGIMIFHSGCDISYNNPYALHRAVKEVLDQRIRPVQ